MSSKKDKKKTNERFLEDYLYTSDKARMLTLVSEMTESAKSLLVKSLKALEERDLHLAQQVAEEDDKIDILEEKIDQECLYSIASRQPLRENLRYVYGIMKIITDLERIGDQSVNLSRQLHSYAENCGLDEPLPKLDEMKIIGQKCVAMADIFLAALKDEDEGILNFMDKKHDEVLVIYLNASTLLLHSLSLHYPEENHIGVYISLEILRHLRRVADHFLNLAERVYFIATGISPLTLKKKRWPKGLSEIVLKSWSDD